MQLLINILDPLIINFSMYTPLGVFGERSDISFPSI